MLRKILLGVAALLVALCVVVALQPAEFKIERRTSIAAPAPLVYGMLTDFHVWDSWSPWSKLDPAMTKTHSGAPQGKGAVYEWSGNDDVGKGRMEITSVRENESVTIDLHFITPFEAKNVTVFDLKTKGSEVEVNWSMTGSNNFMGKAFALFMDMDKMVGGDFEKGLADLKRLAEQKAQSPA